MDENYCKECRQYFIDPTCDDASIIREQEDIEIEKLYEKKRKIKKKENISILFIICGISLASFGSVVVNMELSIWITGALIMSAGLFSLYKSYSNTAQAELKIRTIEVQKNKRALRSDPFLKGYQFESYAATLFPPRVFTFMEVTSRRNDLNDRYVESSQKPDFKMRYEPNKRIFWVECKYRSNLYYGKLKWCEEGQLERYRRLQDERRIEKVYILIGFGGKPDNPESLFCIPLDDISSTSLDLSYCERFRMLPEGGFFDCQGGKLIWRVPVIESESDDKAAT